MSTNGSPFGDAGRIKVKAARPVAGTSYVIDRVMVPTVLSAGEFNEILVQACDEFGCAGGKEAAAGWELEGLVQRRLLSLGPAAGTSAPLAVMTSAWRSGHWPARITS